VTGEKSSVLSAVIGGRDNRDGVTGEKGWVRAWLLDLGRALGVEGSSSRFDRLCESSSAA